MKQRKKATTTPRKKTARPAAAPFIQYPSPGAMGYGCDAFSSNPNLATDPDAPKLVHCTHVATRRMVLENGQRTRTVKRCDGHANTLRRRAARGLIQITSDEPIRG